MKFFFYAEINVLSVTIAINKSLLHGFHNIAAISSDPVAEIVVVSKDK